MAFLNLSRLSPKTRLHLAGLAALSLLLVLSLARWASRVQATDERAAQTVTPGFLAQPIPSARNNHSATLMPNGKILVAGGSTNGQPNGTVGSSFLYDTSSGQWTEVANLKQPRYGHFAVLLPSGKVLIGGGVNATGTEENSAELFDPATGRWDFTGFLNEARYAATATLLTGTSSPRNGMVLITGGRNRDATLSSAELFDPATASWQRISNFQIGRWLHTATLLADGNVLITGGSSQGTTTRTIPIGVSQLYNPVTNSWSTVGDLITPRINFSATLLQNGKVLVTGGATDVTRLENSELYDPATQRWSNTGRLLRSRERHSATLLPNGKVVAAGGLSGQGGNPEEIVEIYDPATGVWTVQPASLIQGRGTHTATLMPDGRILLVAGTATDNEATALLSTEILDLSSTVSWTATSGNLLFKRRAHTATLLANGKVLLAGGYGDNNTLVARAELFDPVLGTFTVTGQLVTPRAEHTATLLPNGKVLLAGGSGANGVLATGELFDPTSGQWAAVTGVMANARVEHSATLLGNGKVLLAGGTNNRAAALATCELFDPTNNSWAAARPLNQARRGHSATLLYDGRVVAAGGAPETGSQTALASSEVYDAANNSWTNAGPLNVDRYEHTATLLPNGKILLVSGKRGSNLAQPNNLAGSAELFDPRRLAWDAATAPQGRADHTATLLFNGQVLLAGGYTVSASSGVSVSVKQTELYDPLRDRTLPFNVITPITQERDGHTATLLPNGKVLIAGGQVQTRDAVALATTAELFEFSLGAPANTAPVIEEIQPWNGPGNPVCLRGSRLQGVSEGATGLWQSSGTNFPVVRLWRLDNEQVYTLAPDPNSTSCFGTRGWSNTSYSSLAVPATTQPGATGNLLAGPSLLTVTANAIPSAQAVFITPIDTGTGNNNLPRGDINGSVYTITGNGFETVLDLLTKDDEFVTSTNSNVNPQNNYNFTNIPAAAPPVIIAQFDPTQIPAGSPSARLTLNVSGLQACSQSAGCNVILFNGVQLPTSQLNQNVLVADVPGTLLLTPGPALVRARTILPGTPAVPQLSAPIIINIVAPQRPVINNLSPSSAQAGSSLTEIALNGSNLLDSNTRILWNGASRSLIANRSTSAQLIFAPLSSDLAQAGSATVQVVTNGGTSNSVTFTITAAPLPAISSLNPASAQVGSVLSEILINGTNLTGSSGPTVFWNNQARTVTRASATQVGFTPQSGDLAQVGTASVRIVTSAGASNTTTFTISQATAAPVITSISPTQSSAQLPFVQESPVTALTLTVNGRNFANDAVVLVSGGVLTVNSRSSTQLVATLPYAASILGTPNSERTLYTVDVSVVNPTAATFSNAVPFSFQQKPTDNGGSVLLFPFYSSDTRNLARHETTITLENQSLSRVPVYVRLLWVNGVTGSVNSTGFVILDAFEVKTIKASNIRPNERGYLIAVASAANGCPVGFDANGVSGTARILQPDGSSGTFSADVAAYVVVASSLPTCGSTATLNFNGSTYDRLPHQLIAGGIPSRLEGTRTDANSTLFVVNAIGGNLSSRASALNSLSGVLYNAALSPFAFTTSTTDSQIFSLLDDNFPRTGFGYNQVLTAGTRGVLTVYPTNTGSAALMSATLNLNRVNNQTTAQVLRPLSVKNASISYTVTPFSGSGLPSAPIEETITSQPTAQAENTTNATAVSTNIGLNPMAAAALTERPYAADPLIPASFVQLAPQQNAPVIYRVRPRTVEGRVIRYSPPFRDDVIPGSANSVGFFPDPKTGKYTRVRQADDMGICADREEGNEFGGDILNLLANTLGATMVQVKLVAPLENAVAPNCKPLKEGFIKLTPKTRPDGSFAGNYSSKAILLNSNVEWTDGLAPEGKYLVKPINNEYLFKYTPPLNPPAQETDEFSETFPKETAAPRAFLNRHFTATPKVQCNTPSATISFDQTEVCAGGTGYSASVPAAGAGATYEWTITGGTLTSTAPFTEKVFFNAGSAGPINLTVKVSVPPSCNASGSLTIPIKAAPTGTASVEQATVCQALSGPTEFKLRGNLSNAVANWTIIERSPGVDGTFDNASAADPTLRVTGAGTLKVQLTAQGSGACNQLASTSSVTLTVNPRPVFETINLPNGARGTAYEQTIRVTGVSNPDFSSTNPPPGLSLSTGGVLSGTPTEMGSFNFTVTVTANGCTSERTYVLNVSVGGLEADVAPRANGDGKVDRADYDLVGNVLAGQAANFAGVELQRADCAPRATRGDGIFNLFDYQQAGRYAVLRDPLVETGGPSSAAASVDPFAYQTNSINEQVEQALATAQPQRAVRLGASSLNTANNTVTVPLEIVALGGEFGLSFSLNFDPAILTNPVLSGAANFPTPLSNLTQINQGRLGLIFLFPPENQQGFTAGTYPIANLTFSINPNAPATTNLTVGDQPMTRLISDVNVNNLTDSTSFNGGSLVLRECPAVTGINPASGLVNTNVTITGISLEGVSEVRFAGNVLANSVSQTATQIIVTVPNGAQNGPLTLTKAGCPEALTSAFTLQACPKITLSPETLPVLTLGTPFNRQFSASGLGEAYTFSFNGTLPAGLTLSPSGLLNGTPTLANTFNFTIVATTPVTNCTGLQSYSVAVTCPLINVIAPSLNTTTPGMAFSQTFAQSGGLGAINWSISEGVLPPGITLNPNTGSLSGTSVQTGAFPITVRATDANGCTGAVNYTLTIACASISINPPSMPGSTAGQEFNVLLSQAGGNEPITWSVSTGSLPNGLSLNQRTGVLSGTPTLAGTFTFSIKATAANGCAGLRDYTLITNPPLCQPITINPTSLANGAVGTAYSIQFTQTGGSGVPTWSISAGALPAGLTLQPNTGVLSGTPSAPGTSTFTVQVTDANNCVNTRQYSVTMNCAYSVTPTNRDVPASGGVNSISVTAANGCPWTATSNDPWLVVINGFSGNGNGTVTFNVVSNTAAARTGTLTVAGQTVTIAQQGTATNIAVVSAASFVSNQPFAPESIVAIFGTNLATNTVVAAILPLPTTLAGTTVRFRDSVGVERLAPLFFVSPSQINCLVPANLASGAATITITAGDAKLSTGTVTLGNVGPGLFSANANGQGVPAGVLFRIAANGTQTIEPLTRLTNGQPTAIPVNLGPVGEQVFLVLFGTGFRGRSRLDSVSASLGGTVLPVGFAGAQGDLAGLDQLNLGALPHSLQGRGTLNLNILVEGQAANTLQLIMQ